MSEKLEYKKRFYDLEKEESWLNEMSEKGLLLKSVTWGFFRDTYTFDHCEKKYTFRLDYTKDGIVYEEITSPYVMFVTSTYKADYVCYMNGRVYFRKSAESGEFPPIYTDPESRIAAEKKRFGACTGLTAVFLFDTVLWGTELPSYMNAEHRVAAAIYLSIILFICLTGFSLCLTRACRHYKKMQDIKKIMKE
ncbi:MAG: DUF2812 domain-containing protein [Oscillospiraceae bacterium]|nr:DUF2812 domain-containing protein [Oscillospiraceae bacterium]